MGRLLGALAVLLVMTIPAQAGLREASEAYDKGDYSGALSACRAAAEQGDASCQNLLGVLYAEGHGVAKSDAEAVRWFRKAAEQGHAHACVNLGRAYEQGLGVKQNNEEAAKWYAKAADQHLPQGELALGLLIAGVDKNYREAVKWFRLAARQGLPTAQATLGLSYETGTGVKRNNRQAAKWYLLAADGGVGFAQASAGRFYEQAIGLEQDLEEAYFWYSVAAANPTTPDKQKTECRTALKRLGGELTRVQIAEAEKAVRDFRPQTNVARVAKGRAQAAGSAHSGPRLVGIGSGFIVTTAGHVVSNNHVVAGCGEMRVTENSRSETIKVLATDPQRDLALLQMPHGADAAVAFRDGTGLKLGEGIVVMGFPFSGLITSEAVVTTGIVSALAGIRDDARELQISAPVQPGNSGGPLLDMNGHVVGVVVAKLNGVRIAQLTGAIPENINFAIKGEEAKAFLKANGVAFSTAPTGKDLSTAAIADQALKYTVRLECWK